MKTKSTCKNILKEIGKFLISCFSITGLGIISNKIACGGFSHPKWISSFSCNELDCASIQYLNYTCDSKKLFLSLLAGLTAVLFILAKRKKYLNLGEFIFSFSLYFIF